MNKFEEFKKELKKIETKTMLKIEKDQWMYTSLAENKQVAYNLYYHNLLLCDYEPKEQIYELIKRYNYTVKQSTTVKNAIRDGKVLNTQIVIFVNKSDLE